MTYTDFEKQTLDMMHRTDFKNLSKSDVINITSQIAQLRPEVATAVLAQFPEFVKLAQSTLSEYGKVVGNVLSSDEESLKQFYDVAKKGLEQGATDTNQFYDFADKVRADLSKCLDNPDLSSEERVHIIDKEMQIFEAVDKKDSEVRNNEKEYVKIAAEKDTEKRLFDWNVIKAASGVVILVAGIGISLLGGNFNIKLPHIK